MLKELYFEAIKIEENSNSPRIKMLHEENNHCLVSVGTYNPDTTEHMFIGLNPGGDPIITSHDLERYNMQPEAFFDYLKSDFKFAENMKILLDSYCKEKNIPLEEASKMFGTTNMSVFHSKSTDQEDKSYNIEVLESKVILMKDFSIPKLKTLIFTGVSWQSFFYNLYKVGSSIEILDDIRDYKFWLIPIKATLINNRSYLCIFIPHLSPRGSLPVKIIKSLGSHLSRYI